MRSRIHGKNSPRLRQRGWGASEYLAVLLGLMVVWRGTETVLALIQEHHDRFAWALMIPY
jgi:hypothetical protein